MIRPAAPSTHTCTAAGCSRQVPIGTAGSMCSPHWSLVPPDLQEAVAQRGGSGPHLSRAVNAVAVAERRPVPYPHAEPGYCPPPPRPRPEPGALDPTILAAVQAGRALTLVEQADIAARHGPVRNPRTAGDAFTCRFCGFRYGKRRPACPSIVFVNAGSAGMRAVRAAFPAPTARRRCRTPGCGAVLTVPAGSADGGLCDSCSAQTDLFGGFS